MNPWDAIVGQNDIALDEGVTYRYAYEVSSSVDGKNARCPRRAVGRPVHRLLHRQRTAHHDDHVVEQHLRAAGDHGPGAGGVPNRRLTGSLDVLRRQRLAHRRIGARAVRSRHRAARPRQPGRVPPQRPEGRHARHRGDRRLGVGADRRRRAGRPVGRHTAGRDRRHVGVERSRDRLQPVHPSRRGLHAHRRRRDQPPVRHLVGGVRAAASRRPVAVLPPAQRHADPRLDRRRRIRPRRRPRERAAEHRRRGGALPDAGVLADGVRRTVDVRLHARRHRRLVRRRRPRQVRRQRRHLGGPADEHVGAQPEHPLHRPPGAGRQHAPRPRARQRRPRRPRRGPLGARVDAHDAGADRQAAGGHGAPQGARQPVDRPATRPGSRRQGARAAPTVDGGDVEPRRCGRPGRPRLRALRRGLLGRAARRRPNRVDGRQRQPGAVRARRRRELRWRSVRRLGRHGRVLLGGRRALS